MSQLNAYNVCSMDCPARLFFETLADKWVLLIITTLEENAQHFNLLKKTIEGISPKVLSQKLKHLERYGFIQRTVLDTSPIRVEYTLTTFGKDFAQTAYQMKLWAEKNIDKVLFAQKEYDNCH
ncbi:MULTISPECIES: winged helix-turn-helix transcriptional regulator [Acinetobacter]|jgi:DNA-binding HxlR family transcriptional regulator|uniref:Helix-turn-helix transcriptional regulator n=1 Tax=Acinetobacter pollinis TaxID=2605270 RepID=A0ABU6DPL7_9GAMM|nr:MULTISPECIES: helix-turn-helix domain-containing protein [Acinetobacter]MBF7690790.1 helix-turn-helix transcriptional regulator [Acinetobacter pollinis]MBF7692609.1 helix-turn-helix transcriptional regulator [Acinetobacter pollinis]MBF7698418.1 helix-turn-helix transcriptional regulator [Acinetobacter pollinis]MBF7699575.1 helix-turn-helix transcriptional regulator [Acinetobacter pollinis]MEB5475813.1 helix-turn-helix transcriptional regulator [Acinetobacter pollinis]